ncbi:MFS transporter [Azorhizobium doebereinerae]|uniref:MFS transporter n=1 Tax=Azorhizobium doebereinerae TaxID=281091 RepID=UPI00040905FF|nr:MFS transporter [Azorhizobium doebereinerae]
MDPALLRVLCVTAVIQLIAWGTASLLAIVGIRMAADLGMDVPTAFAGSTVFYCVMGLCSPILAKGFVRYGARRVMMAGTLVAAPGFALLATASGPPAYFAGWTLLGVSGSAMLSTAAAILIHETAGARAQRAMGALMLATGLSSSLFWPTTAVLADLWGWRATCWIYAGLHLAVCLPLLAFALPARPPAHAAPQPAEAAPQPGRRIGGKRTFCLMMAAIALNGFVAFGFNAIFIELLKVQGVPPEQSVAVGSLLGVLQVSARVIDFLGGGRWDGLTTGLWAGGFIVAAPLIALLADGSLAVIGLFVLVYGLGTGAFAVARSTIPLVFYDQAAYARALSTIALPLNIACAISPPLFTGMLLETGAGSVLGLATACALVTLAALVALRRFRPHRLSTADLTPAG